MASLMTLLAAESAHAREEEKSEASSVSAQAEAQVAALAAAEPEVESVAVSAEGDLAQIEQAAADLEADAEQVADATDSELKKEEPQKAHKPVKAVAKKAAADGADAPAEKIVLADASGTTSATTTATDASAAGAEAGAGAAAAEVTLAAFPAFPVLAGVVAVGAAAAGGGGGGGGGGSAAGTLKGFIVDGPVKGATVFYDANGNGKQDAGESSVTTNADGSFSLAGITLTDNGKIVALGGKSVNPDGTETDIKVPLVAKVSGTGDVVVSPFTTVLASGAISETALKKALSIPDSVNLATYNPYSDNSFSTQDLQVAKAATGLLNALNAVAQSSGNGSGDNFAAVEAISTNLAKALQVAADNNVTGAESLQVALLTATAVASGASVDTVLSQITAAVKDGLSAGELSTVTSNLLASDPAAYAAVVAASDALQAVDDAFEALIDGTGDWQSIGDAIENADDVADDVVFGGTGPATITISDSDASDMVADGIAFASDDTVTVQGPEGTHLQTSLKQMQALGVDVVAAAVAGGEMHINYGTGDLVAGLGAGVPSFNAADSVTVEFADGQLDVLDAAEAAALQAAHVDFVGAADGTMTVDSEMMSGVLSHSMAFDAHDDVTLSLAGGAVSQQIVQDAVQSHIDIIDLESNIGGVTEAQAGQLVAAGIHFAADDTHVTENVSVTDSVAGTHLNTSIKQLGHLGVDVVAMAVAAGAPAELHVQYGTGDINPAAGIPHFNSAADVTVEFTDAQFHSDNANEAFAAKLVQAGVDYLGATDGTLTVDVNDVGGMLEAGLKGFDAHDTVTLAGSDQELDSALDSFGYQDITALGNAHVDILDMVDDSMTITEMDALNLVQAGLQFAEGDQVAVSGEGTYLDNLNLKQLGDLGVDSFDTPDGANTFTVNAGIDFSAMSADQLNSALTELLGKFHPSEAADDLQLFEAEDHAVLDLGNVDVTLISDAVLHEAKLIGIDDILGSDLNIDGHKDGKPTA